MFAACCRLRLKITGAVENVKKRQNAAKSMVFRFGMAKKYG
jgi:hypothetical protein